MVFLHMRRLQLPKFKLFMILDGNNSDYCPVEGKMFSVSSDAILTINGSKILTVVQDFSNYPGLNLKLD